MIKNEKQMDCHAKSNDFLKKLRIACFARNDTHPQTPSAREEDLRGVATLARGRAYVDCHARNDKTESIDCYAFRIQLDSRIF